MKREAYEKLNRVILGKNLSRFLKIANNALTAAVFIFYPTLLVFLYFYHYADLIKMVVVPLGAFIAVSILRYFINAARPYEKMDIKPITTCAKKGKSFPSRHVFSAFMIAFSCLNLSLPLGVVLTVLAIVIAALRILCGVHYIRDVVYGGAVALIAYFIGFICF